MEESARSQLELLERLAQGLAERPDPELLAEELLAQAAELIGAEAGSVLIFEPARAELVFRAVVSPVADRLRGVGVPIDRTSLSGTVFLTGEPLLVPDVAQDPRWFPRIDQASGFTTRSQMLAPLTATGQRIGVIGLLNPTRGKAFTQADLALLQSLAGPIAVALENARLFNELRNAHLETVRLLAAAVEAKDLATLSHIERVSAYAVGTARALGLRGRELHAVEFGAILHDVGKIGVDNRVLLKAGPLDEREWEEMRVHPIIGERILSKSHLLADARLVVRHHHERWDGSGYPDRLAGDRIPLAARVVAVADAFDAMTNDRPYRSGLADETALERLREGAGRHWDPAVVKAFLELWQAGELRAR